MKLSPMRRPVVPSIQARSSRSRCGSYFCASWDTGHPVSGTRGQGGTPRGDTGHPVSGTRGHEGPPQGDTGHPVSGTWGHRGPHGGTWGTPSAGHGGSHWGDTGNTVSGTRGHCGPPQGETGDPISGTQGHGGPRRRASMEGHGGSRWWDASGDMGAGRTPSGGRCRTGGRGRGWRCERGVRGDWAGGDPHPPWGCGTAPAARDPRVAGWGDTPPLHRSRVALPPAPPPREVPARARPTFAHI